MTPGRLLRRDHLENESVISWSWQAIRLLVMTSTSLQKEIVESGRVSRRGRGLAASLAGSERSPQSPDPFVHDAPTPTPPYSIHCHI